MKTRSILLGAILMAAIPPAFAQATSGTQGMKMDPNMPGMAGMHEATPADVRGVGVVKAVDITKGTVTLQHEAIAAIGWPAMTMPFKVASPELLTHVKVGDKVQFTFRQASNTVMSITVQR